MCGRYYYADKTSYIVEDELGFMHGTIKTSAGDITPGMATPGIILNRAGRRDLIVTDLFWGIMSRDKKLIINARQESAAEKSMFLESMEKRRCILPAAGFYEWDRNRTKYIFKRMDESPIYLAGFYDMSENRDSFVILTTAANKSMEAVHERMPVMIDKGNVADYLKDNLAAMQMIKEPMPELSRSSDYEQLSLF